MGKNLKGKELGTGLSQRKDGRYSARFVGKSGKRKEKYFDTLPEARNWLEDAKYEDKHNTALAPFNMVANKVLENDFPIPALSDMTVDEWFDFWKNNIIKRLARNTKRNYSERYIQNIKPVIGKMYVRDVLPVHCLKILNDMDVSSKYQVSTIQQTYIAMGTMFRAAVNNRVIPKHPMDGINYSFPAKAKDDIKVMTIDEHRKFLEVAENSHNYRQYALILETGLRAGEMIGLTWDNVNFEKRTLTVEKTLEYIRENGTWEAGPPKTIAGYRTIPLTDCAYTILKEVYDEKDTRKESEELSQTLPYKDKRDGTGKHFVMKDLVFINYRTGMPSKNSSYDTHLYKLCEKAKIKHFSMHALRHTFATRAIERGVNPKALQVLLGHSSLKTTMDTYVHVTDDFKWAAMELFQKMA